jgi:hypothetical protein
MARHINIVNGNIGRVIQAGDIYGDLTITATSGDNGEPLILIQPHAATAEDHG